MGRFGDREPCQLSLHAREGSMVESMGRGVGKGRKEEDGIAKHLPGT